MRRLTKEQFINKANILHNYKYDYAKYIYINAKTLGVIICKQHGEFLQDADHHTRILQPHGCPVCGEKKSRIKDYVKRFNSKLSLPTKNGCIEWTGHLNTTGYGMIGVQHKSVVVHRFSWELVNGKIPDGLLCLHKCDNPKCVNVEHLFLGTQQDNVDDMFRKGRAKRASGENHYAARFNKKQIKKIRKLYKEGHGQTEIAKIFNTKQNTIFNIVHYNCWKNI